MSLVGCVDFFLLYSKTGGCDCCGLYVPKFWLQKGFLRWCLHTAAMAQRPRPTDVAPPSTLGVTWLEKMSADPGKALRWTTQQQDSLRGRLRCLIPSPPCCPLFFFHLKVLLPTEYTAATRSYACTRPLRANSVRALAAPLRANFFRITSMPRTSSADVSSSAKQY
jgi:hypothetical protein